MELSLLQQKALKVLLDRYHTKEKYAVLSGYAGSGKSTTVKFFIDATKVNPAEDVAYACFTGKAAEVLRKKGNPGACTLHKLLYDHVPKKEGGFMRIPKKELGYKIIVADECSMIPKTMVDQLLQHKVFILFLGDPFQLPPIKKDDGNTLLEHPHFFLDEVHRQAADSEIIRITMDIRENKPLSIFNGEDVKILPKRELNTGMLLWSDIVLTATNATRHSINKQIRELKGYKGLLEEGEKIICKRNYWDDINDDGDALVNGTIGTVKNCFESFRRIPGFVQSPVRNLKNITCDFTPEGSTEFKGIEIDQKFLTEEKCCVDWKVAYQLGKLKQKFGEILPKELTYGYAITCHAAQGSEWDRVLVLEERFPFDKLEHARWLYTAATRAASRLVLLQE